MLRKKLTRVQNLIPEIAQATTKPEAKGTEQEHKQTGVVPEWVVPLRLPRLQCLAM